MKNRTPKKVFIEGAIPPEKIAKSLVSHSSKTDIDEHGMYMRQVKSKHQDVGEIVAIDFKVDVEKAEKILFEIREDAFSKFSLTCMHIYHSTGRIEPGQLYLFIFTSSTDQNQALMASGYIADRIRTEVQIEEHILPLNPA